MVITGAYDGMIRLWTLNTQSTLQNTSTPEKKLIGHKSNVNTLCFNLDGSRLYSADGLGFIKVWSSEKMDGNPSQDLSYECIKTIDALQVSRLYFYPRDPLFKLYDCIPAIENWLFKR